MYKIKYILSILRDILYLTIIFYLLAYIKLESIPCLYIPTIRIYNFL